MFGIAMQLLTAIALAVAILLNSTGSRDATNYALFLAAMFLVVSVAASLKGGEDSPDNQPPAQVAPPPAPTNTRRGFVPATPPESSPAQNTGEIRGFTF